QYRPSMAFCVSKNGANEEPLAPINTKYYRTFISRPCVKIGTIIFIFRKECGHFDDWTGS
ncbi:hypothetical protein, partial [Aerococcus sp. Group 1]|uniref:hypothetical protein n=1 Tax=Aerococcus urinae (strain CCUG 59500 / ACS-120-V-Col10a) TaxID=2976812 RepID=UPI00227B1284